MAATDISQLGEKQLQRAQRIITVASEYLHLDLDVVVGALTTANDESTFRVYANDGSYAGQLREQVWGWYGGQVAYRAHMLRSLTFDHDAVAGADETTKDSLNLFQQREMYGYGTLDQLMDPDYCTRVFCAGVPGVRSWTDRRVPAELRGRDDLSIAKRCQWVQGSEFPTGENYLEAVHVAHQIIARFGLPTEVEKRAAGHQFLSRLLHWS